MKNKKPSLGKLAELVINAFYSNPGRELNYKQLSKILHVTDHKTRQLLLPVLQKFEEDGTLKQNSRGKYTLAIERNTVEGVIEFISSGAAFVITDNLPEDIYINTKHCGKALNGDTVRVALFLSVKGNKPEGEVVEVVSRARSGYTGIIQESAKYAFLLPDDHKMPVDIYIPLNKLNGARNGDKVIVSLLDWPDDSESPIGQVTEVLGKPGDNEAEIHSILIEYGLPRGFPQKLEEEAKKIPLNISSDEISKRKDFREILTFTIDPVDAKDFDDALSYRILENGNTEVGVHIADVTHYVKPDTEIEKEAAERATSIYLVDRVIPMLPEVLSNQVCSLRPNEEKLCFSAVFELNDNAELINQWFGKTIIFSQKRFTYEEAQLLIEKKETNEQFSAPLLALDSLAKKLRAKRIKSGAIAFEGIEVKFNLDSKGKPVSVYFKEQKDSNKLIEEFMLLANRKVSEFIGKPQKGEKQKTFVYRVHDYPDPAKLEDFSLFLRKIGYNFTYGNPKKISDSMNKLMEEAHGKRESNLISKLAVRTMAKAFYTTKNIGHYGLAFDYYSHFTSPIRRYPDMLAHRLLETYLANQKPMSEEKLEHLCKHSSKMERLSEEAERASVKFKQVEFLKDKIGQVFEGVVSGVTEWGMFVEITENKCEGMIRLRDLKGDYFIYDEKNYRIIGKRTGEKYQLGDTVNVLIKKADLLKKQIDMELADEY
jgi:ribonuclease R